MGTQDHTIGTTSNHNSPGDRTIQITSSTLVVASVHLAAVDQPLSTNRRSIFFFDVRGLDVFLVSMALWLLNTMLLFTVDLSVRH
jgi:predicted nuclease with RNAse H fold